MRKKCVVSLMTQIVRPVSAASAVQQLQLAVLQNERKRGWSFTARQTNTAHIQTVLLCSTLNIDRIKNMLSDLNELYELQQACFSIFPLPIICKTGDIRLT
jgi:hypothetical protein